MIEEMNIVAESIIKIEKIKEEPVEEEEEYSWNSIAEDKHSTLQHSVKQDDIRDIEEEPVEIKEEPVEIKEEPVEIKEEPVEIKEEYSCNSIAEDKHGTLQHSVKQDDIGDNEVLQLPISLLLQPIEKQERDFVDEMQDPLAPSCESASGGVCSPDRELHGLIPTNTSENPFQCSIYEKSFSVKGKLHSHVRTHAEKLSFACSICEKSFRKKPLFLKHLRHHSGDEPFQCFICAKSVRVDSLQKHLRIHSAKPFQCAICAKIFTTKWYFKRHMLIHSEGKPFQCAICQNSFIEKRALKIHMLIHTDERPFQCAICPKSFREKGTLQIHMRTHTGKPFQCDVCGKRYCTKSSLHLHMRSHDDEKTFQCAICEKSFHHKGTLKDHMRSHTGERFNCSTCAEDGPKKPCFLMACTGEEKAFKNMSAVRLARTIEEAYGMPQMVVRQEWNDSFEARTDEQIDKLLKTNQMAGLQVVVRMHPTLNLCKDCSRGPRRLCFGKRGRAYYIFQESGGD